MLVFEIVIIYILEIILRSIWEHEIIHIENISEC